MKFVKILHYVESSFEGKPSFVLEMSDGKEYISNGCVWKENTQANLHKLIDKIQLLKFIFDVFFT